MQTRPLGSTGRDVSVVGLGCWQLGADWGDVGDHQALDVLHAAVAAGVTFLDTADVYGDGRSEALIGRFHADRGREGITVATKVGRRADPHVAAAYTADAFRQWVDRSRSTLGVDTLDLVQRHCPPPDVLCSDAVYDALDDLVDAGAVAAYGVSVETSAQALAAMEHAGVASVQVVLNVLRRRPVERVLPRAAERGVAVIARVPLASGLLSGGYDASTTFAADDHRSFNREGAAFDVGETFSGVPFDVGLAAAREVARWAPEGVTTAQTALRWVLDQPGVTTVIPGARSAEQARANAAAAAVAPLPAPALDGLADVYDRHVRELVHDRW